MLNEVYNKIGKANNKIFVSDICEDNDDTTNTDNIKGNNTYDKVWSN